MRKFEKTSMPLGMVGVLGYMLHTIIGNLLWKEYNPITTDISSLTGATNPIGINFKIHKISLISEVKEICHFL